MPDFQGRYLKQGTSGTYGNESLPNIKGTYTDNTTAVGSNFSSGASITTGALAAYNNPTAMNGRYASPAGFSNIGIQINANAYSSVYQDNAKVNPDNAEIMYCIKY